MIANMSVTFFKKMWKAVALFSSKMLANDSYVPI